MEFSVHPLLPCPFYSCILIVLLLSCLCSHLAIDISLQEAHDRVHVCTVCTECSEGLEMFRYYPEGICPVLDIALSLGEGSSYL